MLALATAGVFVPPYLVGGTTAPNLDRITPGYYTSLVIHAVPAGIALITGPWQFVPKLLLTIAGADPTGDPGLL